MNNGRYHEQGDYEPEANKPTLCEHCETYHTIYEEYAKCQEARYFRLTLDKWERDWDNDATDLEIQRRLDQWVRNV